ncbi:hypothetical protein Tco_0993920 [Tanacetum coccineum]
MPRPPPLARQSIQHSPFSIQARDGKQESSSKRRQARVVKQETASKSRQARYGKQESSSKRRQARVVKQETASKSRQARYGKQESSSKRRQARVVKQEWSKKSESILILSKASKRNFIVSIQARDGKQESSSKSRQARVDKKETGGKQETAIDEKAENTVKECTNWKDKKKDKEQEALLISEDTAFVITGENIGPKPNPESSSKSRQARVDKKETGGKQETAIDEKAENTVKECTNWKDKKKDKEQEALLISEDIAFVITGENIGPKPNPEQEIRINFDSKQASKRNFIVSIQARVDKQESTSKGRQARVDKKETGGKQETTIDEKAENTVKECTNWKDKKKDKEQEALLISEDTAFVITGENIGPKPNPGNHNPLEKPAGPNDSYKTVT